MRLKDLKIELSKVKGFQEMNYKLEQYVTPAELAALVIHTIHNTYNDIENKTVLDLCCGTGMLSIASSFFNPKLIFGIDICEKALNIYRENLLNFDVSSNIIRADLNSISLYDYNFDVVIMNPPFGTKIKHMDTKAVTKALSLGNVVYSMHKKSTRDFLLKSFPGAKVIAEMKYELPRIYDFHKKKIKIIEVDFIRFGRKN